MAPAFLHKSVCTLVFYNIKFHQSINILLFFQLFSCSLFNVSLLIKLLLFHKFNVSIITIHNFIHHTTPQCTALGRIVCIVLFLILGQRWRLTTKLLNFPSIASTCHCGVNNFHFWWKNSPFLCMNCSLEGPFGTFGFRYLLYGKDRISKEKKRRKGWERQNGFENLSPFRVANLMGAEG